MTGAKKYLLKCWEALKPIRPCVAHGERKRKQGIGWPMLKKRPMYGCYGLHGMGNQAGNKLPQRPHGRPQLNALLTQFIRYVNAIYALNWVKVQSTPLINIGKPRVYRIIVISQAALQNVMSIQVLVSCCRQMLISQKALTTAKTAVQCML